MNNINELYENATKAYWAIADWDQEKIDTMLEHMAAAVFKNATELGAMVYEETKIGDPETCVMLMHAFPVSFWSYLKGKDAFGLLKDDKARGIKTYGKAMGVVACLTPSTTHITNGFENIMKSLKSGNAVIMAPHPLAWKSHKRMIEIMMEAGKEVGAPDYLIQSLEEPTIEDTGKLMSTCDVVVGTGGAEMVKAAYSSGTPAFGVGQGCVPVLYSPTWPAEEVEKYTQMNIIDRITNGGVPCTCPQMVYIPRSREAEFVEAYKKNGAFLIEDKETIDRIRDVVFPDGGTRINRKVVGKPIRKLAEMYGVKIPEGAQAFLIRMPSGVYGAMDTLCCEIMNCTLRYQVYDSFEEAVELARKGLFFEGAGHSAQVFSYSEDEIELAAKRLPVVRLMVRQGSAGVPNLFHQNGLAPSTSVGCGTWGGTSFSDNLDYTLLQNHTMVVYPQGEGGLPTPEELFGDLIK